MTQDADIKRQTQNYQAPRSLDGSLYSLADKPESDFDSILGRMKTACLAKTDKMLAEALEVQYSTITTSRRRGSVPASWLLTIADKAGVSVDWLRTGEGEMRRGAAQSRPEPASAAQSRPEQVQAAPTKAEAAATIYNDMGAEEFNMGEILAQTIDILNSKTVYTTAIVSNIKAFHKAISTEKKIDDMQTQLNQAMSSFQDQLDKIQAENQQLRQELEQSRAEAAVRNTG